MEDAKGLKLAHDVTEIIPGVIKHVAFRRGHIIEEPDISRLKKLGKNHVYVVSAGADDMHEEEAALAIAKTIAGNNIDIVPAGEGKVNLVSSISGLARIDRHAIRRINMAGGVSLASIHDRTPCARNTLIAACRITGLYMDRKHVESIVDTFRDEKPVNVRPIVPCRVGVVITGDEIFYGEVADGFEDVVRNKVGVYGCSLDEVVYSPDNPYSIALGIRAIYSAGCGLIVVTGGLSVDPDDATREGALLAGASGLVHGIPVMPGSMLLTGTLEGRPLIGVPACALYNEITAFDLILPRMLAGECITHEDASEMGYGGLCGGCITCTKERCRFGKC